MKVSKISFNADKTSKRNNSNSDVNITLSKNQAASIGAFSVLGGMVAGADCYENLQKMPKPKVKNKLAYSK